jgi:hypothetical protein
MDAGGKEGTECVFGVRGVAGEDDFEDQIPGNIGTELGPCGKFVWRGPEKIE